MKKIYYWIGKYSETKYGPYLLSFLIFLEGFLPIPTAPILAFYCLQNKKKIFLYALIASIASIFAALTGYLLGDIFWDYGGKSLITFFISENNFNKGLDFYKKYQELAILLTAVLPVPFKIFAIGAGVAKLPLIKFLTYAFIARSIRFFTIATAIYIWGEKVNSLLNKYFYYIIILGIIIFLLIGFIIHKLIYVYL